MALSYGGSLPSPYTVRDTDVSVLVAGDLKCSSAESGLGDGRREKPPPEGTALHPLAIHS